MDCRSHTCHSAVGQENRTLTGKLGDGSQRARCLHVRFWEVCADVSAAVFSDKVKVAADRWRSLEQQRSKN